MPLFGKKKKDSAPQRSMPKQCDSFPQGNGIPYAPAAPNPEFKKPKYNFHCQLAHGSPTGLITGFTNVNELYMKIAQCYDIEATEIIFCTLNTHKVDMTHLLGGQIALDDFIFAHIKGQKKEIDIYKNEDSLGLTITDNGAGYAFIKRIKSGSVADKADMVDVGDHVEKINGESFVGKRHFEVARRLKEIPIDSTFTIRLVSPEKTPFANVGPRSGAGATNTGISSGKKTLRLRASGAATEEDAPTDVQEASINSICTLIESILGVSDQELAQRIFEIGNETQNPHDFSEAINQEMGDFCFPDDLIFDFWGSIDDAKAGRLPKNAEPVYTNAIVFEDQL